MEPKSENLKALNYLRHLFLWINTTPSAQKYSFQIEEGKVHYTIRVWNDRKVVDLHRTDDNVPDSDSKHYITITEISFYSISRFLVLLKTLDLSFITEDFRTSRISAGKLKRYKCILSPFEGSKETKESMLKIKKSRSGERIKFHKNLNFKNIVSWIEIDDVFSHPASAYMVYRLKGGNMVMNGQIIKLLLSNGQTSRRFYYLPSNYFNLLGRKYNRIFIEIIKRIQFTNKEDILNHLNSKV